MTKKLFFIFTVFVILTSCNNVGQKRKPSTIDKVKIYQNSLSNNQNDQSEITINCDSIYKDKGITIKLTSLDTSKLSEPYYKYIFQVTKQQNGEYTEIYRDTIQSIVQEVKFSDFNNDNVKDILIQNNSDVRSNWTYNLYIVDKNVDRIMKIKGFEEIKNPNYLPKYNLIDNMVMSGQNWTSFYEIEGDTIKDFGIVIYEGEGDNGKNNYDKDYKKAIEKITKNKKNNR